MKKKILISLLFCSLVLFGCKHLGPKTIRNDRFNYGAAIASSWTDQTLLNIVKLRYLDAPVYLDVGQIVSSYTFHGDASVGGTLSTNDSLSIGAGGFYEERPTITYVPLTGPDFLKGIMVPIEPSIIFFLIESGYRASTLLELTAESLNGLKNRPSIFSGNADPEFVRSLELIDQIQQSGGFGIRVEKQKEGESTVFFFRSEKIDPQTREKIDELRTLLGLQPGQNHLRLVYSPVHGGEDEFAIGTRSLLQIQIALAQGVQVPPEDIEQKRAVAVPEQTASSGKPGDRKLLDVHWDKDRPADAYAAINYRNKWFWISDTDLLSKRTFGFMMLLFTITNTGEQQKLPVLTIGAN